MALLSISGSTLTVNCQLTGSVNPYTTQPTDVTPSANSATVKKSLTFVLGGNTAGGINQLASFITTITAAGNTSVDLTTIGNILGQTAITLLRLKAIFIRLLSTTDDSANGTAASSVTINNTVTNALAAQSHTGWFDNGAEGAAGGSKFTIPNGGFLLWGTVAAAGLAVDSTHKIINYVNNDGANAAAVETTLFAADA